MAIVATKYKSVYKRVGLKDTTYLIKYKLAGKVIEEIVGKESEAMTAKKASEILDTRKNHNLDRNIEIVSANKAKSSFHKLATKYFEQLWILANSEEGLEYRDRQEKTPKNIKSEESLYQNFWGSWTLKVMPISKIREKHVNDFIQTKKSKYSDKSIYNAITLAKSIMKHTVKLHGNLNNPFLLNNIEFKNTGKLTKGNNRKEYLTSKQCTLLLNNLKATGTHQNYTMTLTSLMTGARPNSVLSLKIKDIDYRKKEINFYDFKRKQVYQSKLTPELEEAINIQSEGRRRDNYLFSSDSNDKQMSGYPSSISRVLDTLFNDFKKDGEERIVPYTFRHTFANLLLLEYKVPVFEVSQLLNHASVQTTIDNYITFNHEHLVKDLMAFETGISGESTSHEDQIQKELENLDVEIEMKDKIKELIMKLVNL